MKVKIKVSRQTEFGDRSINHAAEAEIEVGFCFGDGPEEISKEVEVYTKKLFDSLPTNQLAK